MKTVIKGKIIKNCYSLDLKAKQDENGELYYEAKPMIVKTSDVSWNTILEFDGELHYNDNPFFWASRNFNISEDETVKEEKRIFRADLNEVHVFSSKVISEEDIDKGIVDGDYIYHMSRFNEQMIESDEKLLAYCKLHKLYPGDTDVEELFKLVYGKEYYWDIEDGKLVVHSHHHNDQKIASLPYTLIDGLSCEAITVANGLSTYTTSATL